MSQENKFEVHRPFGPTVAKFIMPDALIKTLNDYSEKIIVNKKKIERIRCWEKISRSSYTRILFRKRIHKKFRINGISWKLCVNMD